MLREFWEVLVEGQVQKNASVERLGHFLFKFNLYDECLR